MLHSGAPDATRRAAATRYARGSTGARATAALGIRRSTRRRAPAHIWMDTPGVRRNTIRPFIVIFVEDGRVLPLDASDPQMLPRYYTHFFPPPTLSTSLPSSCSTYSTSIIARGDHYNDTHFNVLNVYVVIISTTRTNQRCAERTFLRQRAANPRNVELSTLITLGHSTLIAERLLTTRTLIRPFRSVCVDGNLKAVMSHKIYWRFGSRSRFEPLCEW